MGPPSYMRSIVDQNVVTWRMTIYVYYDCFPVHPEPILKITNYFFCIFCQSVTYYTS